MTGSKIVLTAVLAISLPSMAAHAQARVDDVGEQLVNDFVHGAVEVDKELTAFLMPNLAAYGVPHHGAEHHAHHNKYHQMPAFDPFAIFFGGSNLFPMPQPIHNNFPNLGGLF